MIKIHWRILSSLKVISRSSYQNVLKFKKKKSAWPCIPCIIFSYIDAVPLTPNTYFGHIDCMNNKNRAYKRSWCYILEFQRRKGFLNNLNQLHSLELKVRPEKPGDSHMVTRLLSSRAGDQNQNPDPDQLSTNPLLFPITQMSFLDKKQI